MIKAVFFDVDGTLTSMKDHKVPKSARLAISKLQDKGILCFMATGRHILELAEMDPWDIAFDGYVTTNGEICLNKQREVIYDIPIEGDIKEGLVRMFTEKTMPLLFVEKERMYHNFIDQRVIDAYGMLGTSIPDVGEYKGDRIYQACTYKYADEDDSYQKLFPQGVRFMWWHNNCIDLITNEGKVEGIKHILTLYHLDPQDVMAFGDAENDIDMLRYVGTSVVMGNGDDHVKKLADHVTDSVEDDGIYKALVYYKLID